jgi:hypothetical protein
VRYSFSHNHAENALSTNPTNSTVDASALELDTTHAVLTELNSALSRSRFNVLRFQWSHEGRRSEPNSGGPAITVGGLGSTGRYFFYPARPFDDRYQLTDTFTLLRGRHSLRFGAGASLMPEGTSYFVPFGGGNYIFGSVTDYLQTVNTGEQAWARLPPGLRPTRRSLRPEGAGVLRPGHLEAEAEPDREPGAPLRSPFPAAAGPSQPGAARERFHSVRHGPARTAPRRRL